MIEDERVPLRYIVGQKTIPMFGHFAKIDLEQIWKKIGNNLKIIYVMV